MAVPAKGWSVGNDLTDYSARAGNIYFCASGGARTIESTEIVLMIGGINLEFQFQF